MHGGVGYTEVRRYTRCQVYGGAECTEVWGARRCGGTWRCRVYGGAECTILGVYGGAGCTGTCWSLSNDSSAPLQRSLGAEGLGHLLVN